MIKKKPTNYIFWKFNYIYLKEIKITIKNDFNKRIAVNIFIISNNITIKLFKTKFSYNDESLSID